MYRSCHLHHTHVQIMSPAPHTCTDLVTHTTHMYRSCHLHHTHVQIMSPAPHTCTDLVTRTAHMYRSCHLHHTHVQILSPAPTLTILSVSLGLIILTSFCSRKWICIGSGYECRLRKHSMNWNGNVYWEV